MQWIKHILLSLFLIFTTSSLFANNQIVICTDANFWYPFTYIKNQEPTGLHIDIITTALHRIHKEPIFKSSSWKECLENAKLGIVDAVATTSYQDERAAYLNYPEGAAVDQKSPWRVSQVGYVLITATLDEKGKPNEYRFKGNFKTIPEPVRVPAHYSISHDLKKEGLVVKEGKRSLDNFKKLIKDRTGSIVDVEEVAEYFTAQPQFFGKLTIQQQPFNNKSYYLAFAKNGKVDLDQAKQIWQEIAAVRNDKKQMAEFLKKY